MRTLERLTGFLESSWGGSGKVVIMTSGKGKENGLIYKFVPRIEEDFPNTPGVTEFLREFFYLFVFLLEGQRRTLPLRFSLLPLQALFCFVFKNNSITLCLRYFTKQVVLCSAFSFFPQLYDRENPHACNFLDYGRGFVGYFYRDQLLG